MSLSTTHTSILLLFFAIWALVGMAARLVSAMRLTNPQRKRLGIVNAAFCLAAALVFASSLLFENASYSTLLGIGLMCYAAGSFVPPRRRQTRSS